MELKILNTKETKKILNSIEKQYGAKLKVDFVFLKNKKNRIFIVSRGISKIDFSELRVNSVGMYFCELNEQVRLSIEGSQIVGAKAKKNFVEIDGEEVKKWFKGEDLEIKGNYEGFVILKHNDDFLGSGKFKDGKILNYVGKGRRVNLV